MSVAAPRPRPGTFDLKGTGLLIPSLQSEPFPVTTIKPAPCTQMCPAGVNVKAYVSLIAEGRFAEALEVIRMRNPLPGICGRICHAPCETACRRQTADEAVAIRSLKRFVADQERELPPPAPPRGADCPQRVAVIGSGPAGLTAGYDLRLAGYPVTVFESEPDPGGMLRYGITAYRLPREIIDAEIEVIHRAGVEIQTGRRLGKDLELEALLQDGFDAVLLAVGAQLGRALGIPGEDECSEVEDALAFLRRVNNGQRERINGKVVVIGGGSTAVEAARASLRLGAESVQILYRRYREEMLVSDEEVEAAQAEGVVLQFLVAPKRAITENGRLKALECIRVGLGEPDAGGRRRPIQIPGSEYLVECDRVFAAVGQKAELDFAPSGKRMLRKGGLVVNPKTAMTRMKGVFAAGDVATGPATVIDAIAEGHRAAESIRHYLEEGKPDIREERPELRAAEEYGLPDVPPIEAQRRHPATRLPRPGREFAEVEQAFDEQHAVAEARRCLRCGPCGECRVCVPSCNRRHIMVRIPGGNGDRPATALVRAPSTVAMGLATASAKSGWLLPSIEARNLTEIDTSACDGAEALAVRARIVKERCRACGQCVEVCPFHAVSVVELEEAHSHAYIEPALCRGCNLCTAVCPTEAALPSALSPEWWGDRVEDVFRPTVAAAPATRPYVVLACQRRAGALERALDRHGHHVEVIRFRCVGQMDAGMLLELHRQGAKGVLVAGCETQRCRFGEGARLAEEQVGRARSMLRILGQDDSCFVADWSKDRAGDLLDIPLERFLAGDDPQAAPSARS